MDFSNRVIIALLLIHIINMVLFLIKMEDEENYYVEKKIKLDKTVKQFVEWF